MKFWGLFIGFVVMGLNAVGAWAGDRAILTTTDFSSGSLAVVNLETHQATVNLLNIHSDASVQTYRGKIYVVNRLGQDNILVLDPDDLTTPVLQFSVGNGSNPQHIAFASETKAYVSRLKSERVLVVNPATGDSLGGVDLSFVADADGLPEATFLTIFDGRLYVTCQRLDRDAPFWPPTDRSEVVVVDVNTDTVIDLDSTRDGTQGIVLQASNPFGGQVRVGAKLYLSCLGRRGALDGGIEVLDLQNNRSEGVLLSEVDLGGDAGAFAMVSQDRGYVVVADDASFVNSVRGFNLAAGSVSAPLPGTSGGFTPAIGALKGRLYVLDQGSSGSPETVGLRVYDTSADTLVAGPISTGLPPNFIAFLEDATVADFDGDGDVDFGDFVAFARAFGTGPGSAEWAPKFDLDGDGRVNFGDFVIFARLFGHSG